MTGDAWDALVARGEFFTCYSSALATWLAVERDDWPHVLDPGLWLGLTEEGEGLFGFSHFPPGLGASLGLRRRTAADAATAWDGVRAELAASGRVIVAGDGFQLPWHVAHGRKHVPHWYALVGDPGAPEVLDPFDCRTELGRQRAGRHPFPEADAGTLLRGLPGDDPVFALREAFALGTDARPLPDGSFTWLEAGTTPESATAYAAEGPAAIARLERHFRDRGSEAAAYRQADDLWSIARHRVFTLQGVTNAPGSATLAWVEDHLQPLVARWGHVAPLIMQAELGLRAGRAPSGSLATALAELAEREAAAAAARPIVS